MVKSSELSWFGKVAEFKQQQYITLSECSAFFLDILQCLYEDISDKVKIELLLLLQEYGEVLVQGQESAEQAVGALKNFLCSDGNLDKFYLTHCLVTTTTLIIQFNLFEFNPILVKEITKVLLSMCRKVNIASETMIRKTASECLIELETAIPMIISENIYILFELAKHERSFVSQNYTLLLSTVARNIFHEDIDQSTPLDSENKLMMSRVDVKDAQQIASYTAGELGQMSPTILWQTGQNVSDLFTCLEMPEVVLQNKMIECWYSSNLQVLHLGLLLGLERLHGVVNVQDLFVIVECLMSKIVIPAFPNGVRAICLEWLLEVIQEINFFTSEGESLILDLAVRLRKQLALDSPYILKGKLEILSEFAAIYPGVFNYFYCLDIPLKLAYQGISGSYLSTLYRAFYLQFTQHEESDVKNKIKDHIVQMTLQYPNFMGHAIDFIRAIKKPVVCDIRLNLIHQITSFILKQDEAHFTGASGGFFPLIELASSEKELWPLGIVKWMKSLCLKSTICKLGEWEFGSNILSVCRAILANHNDVQLLYELADFLWLLHQTFNDQDVKDRALFLYLIIGHSSPKYFEMLFNKSSEDSKMQSFGRRAEIKVPADLVRGILPTISLDEPFLTIEKSVIYRMQKKCDMINLRYGNYDNYMKVLLEFFERSIDLRLMVKFSPEVENDKMPKKAYALSLKFNSSCKCKGIPQVHLPYLCKIESSSKKFVDMAFLKIEPYDATPFSIYASCTFTNEDGRICCAPAPSINLTFSDFFHPLVQLSDNEQSKQELFKSLWDHCEQNRRTAKNSPNSCLTSLKRLIIKDEDIRLVLNKKWHPFVIKEEGNNTKIGIFLSPRYHLLMTLNVSAEQTIIRFCIDNWKLLDVVEDYLDSIPATQE